MAQLVTDEAEFAAQSRIVAIRLAALTLRLRTSWIELFGSPDQAAIMLAVGAIRAERLLRDRSGGKYNALESLAPEETWATCNVSSIASASGLNRETTRRKVDGLLKSGKLLRDENGIKFPPELLQAESFARAIRSQFDQVLGTGNAFLKDGVVRNED